MKRINTKLLGYVGLIINYLMKRRVGFTREGLDEYHYLKHKIQLWPGDWVKQMEKINEAVGMNNRVTVSGGGKRIVRNFISQELWKFIDCVLLAVTYGGKGHNLWSEIPKYFVKKAYSL